MIQQGQYKGINYFYESYGLNGIHDLDTKPIIYIGGAFQSIQSIKPITQGLLNYSSVIAIDLPGFGGGDLLDSSYSFDFYCELLEDFFNKHGINEVGIIGASYGSAIAYLLAYSSNRITSLTLAGTMKAIPDYQRENILRSLRELETGNMNGFADTAVRVLMNFKESNEINRFHAVSQMLHRAMKRLVSLDRLKYIQNTQRLLNMQLNLNKSPSCKTLVFTGEFDAFTTPEYCFEICRSMPNSQMVVIRNADHMFHVEQLPTTLQLFASPHKDNGILMDSHNHYEFSLNEKGIDHANNQFA